MDLYMEMNMDMDLDLQLELSSKKYIKKVSLLFVGESRLYRLFVKIFLNLRKVYRSIQFCLCDNMHRGGVFESKLSRKK